MSKQAINNTRMIIDVLPLKILEHINIWPDTDGSVYIDFIGNTDAGINIYETNFSWFYNIEELDGGTEDFSLKKIKRLINKIISCDSI